MKNIFTDGLLVFAFIFSLNASAMGSRQPKCPAEDQFANAFPADEVAELGNQAYEYYRRARFLAQLDYEVILNVRGASARDQFTMYALRVLEKQVPWIPKKITDNPDNPRCASYRSSSRVQADFRYLDGFWENSAFSVGTKHWIELAVDSTKELLPYYELKSSEN